MNNNKLDEKQISYRNISLYKKLCSLSLAYIVKSAPFWCLGSSNLNLVVRQKSKYTAMNCGWRLNEK